MDRLDQLNTLYDHYRTELAKVKKAAGHGGFMGLGMDPRKHPCNQEFYEAVEAWVRQFLAQSPTHVPFLPPRNIFSMPRWARSRN